MSNTKKVLAALAAFRVQHVNTEHSIVVEVPCLATAMLHTAHPKLIFGVSGIWTIVRLVIKIWTIHILWTQLAFSIVFVEIVPSNALAVCRVVKVFNDNISSVLVGVLTCVL